MADKSFPLLLAGLAGLVAIGAGTFYFAGSQTPAANVGVSAQAPVEKDCSKYLRCAALKVMREASLACKAPIEQLAAFNPQWTQPGADSIFNDYSWLDERKGTITFTGNKVEFQNAGGAKMPVAYECDFDPAANVVIDARARVGAAR